MTVVMKIYHDHDDDINRDRDCVDHDCKGHDGIILAVMVMIWLIVICFIIMIIIFRTLMIVS